MNAQVVATTADSKTIRIPKQTADRAKIVAIARGTTTGQLIDDLIRDQVDTLYRDHVREVARERPGRHRLSK